MSVELQNAAQMAIDLAKQQGVDQAEVACQQGSGVSVAARKQELETVEKNNDAQLIVSVFKDHKTGSASSADLSEAGIKSTVEAAISIATYTGADDCLGLADKQLMASDFPDLQLYHPWDLPVADLVDLALQCEQAALDYDKRISNSEGAAVNSYAGSSVYANSHGFISHKQGTQHSISCSVIGSSKKGMQRDYWYDSNRDASQLLSAKEIGLKAAERTVKRLDARKIATTQVPVIFDATVASSLLSHLIGAIKGGAIHKKASFMLDKVGETVFPEFISIAEHPHRLGGVASSSYDNEGVATPEYREIVENGVLQSYVLGSYTARKLNLKTTANAGGVRNLTISDSGQDFQQLLAEMDTGLLVTELIGLGINMVTGDYSRGAAGFWVEGGEIQYPVEEITIAGKLPEMFQGIVAVGKDSDLRGNIQSGSILIKNMTVAGS